jgi:beta-phosphoglucomutase-like phosphatase (HAD superfamily)
MTKLIIFDLDGVLVDAKQIHFETLNKALWEIAQSNKSVSYTHLRAHETG